MTEPQPQHAAGRVFTFYSYSGGSGRSAALASAAWMLASNGSRVLVVDWSFAAPAMHRLFAPFLDDPDLEQTDGAIEMITDYISAVLRPPEAGESGDDSAWVESYTSVLDHCITLDHDFPEPGFLDLLPAGRQTVHYPTLVSSVDWSRFRRRLGGRSFLASLRRDMTANYDYVLVDGPNGTPDAAVVSALELADTVALCARPHDVGIRGLVGTAGVLARLPRERQPVVVPVLTQVDQSEPARVDAARQALEFQLGPLLPAQDLAALTEIPYHPAWTFGETPAFIEEAEDDQARTAYQRLTKVLTDGAVSGPPVALEEEASTVLVSYAAYDRVWAEWLRAQLELADVRCRLVNEAADDQELTDPGPGTRVVVLLSEHYYFTTSRTAGLWQTLLDREEASGRRILIPVRIDYSPPPDVYQQRTRIELAAKEPLEARDSVLGVLNREVTADSETANRSLLFGWPVAEEELDWITNLDRRNREFFGRTAVLEQIRDELVLGRSPAPGPRTVVLHAPDGMGKGEVAHEYAYRFASDYDIAWRVPLEEANRRSSLAELAQRLKISPLGHDDDRNVREVLEALPQLRILLIFENVEDPQETLALLPAESTVHVIVNATQPAGGDGVADVELGAFSRDESISFLRSRTVNGAAPLSRRDCAELADRLDDLPLALEQAVAALNGGVGLAEFTESLTRRLRALGPGEGAQVPLLIATWLISLDQLRAVNPTSAELVDLCASFGPAAIPWSFLSGDSIMRFLRLKPSEKALLEQAIDDMGRYSLVRIQPESESVEMHRLVRQAVLDAAMEFRRTTNRDVVAAALAEVPRGKTERTESWPTYRLLWPHVVVCAVPSANESARELVADCVRAAWRYGSWTSAMELADAAITAWREGKEQDDIFVLRMRYHRVNVLWSQGRFGEVRREGREVYDAFTERLGSSSEDALATATILAAGERALGFFEPALELDRTTHRLLSERYGESNVRRLNAANNLAVSERLTGHLERARTLDEETLQKRRNWLGDQHAYTLQSYAALGQDLRDLGLYAGSADSLRVALRGLELQLGQRHEDTIRTRKSLSVTERKLGEAQPAWEQIERAGEDARAVFEADHPDLLAIILEQAAQEASRGNHQQAHVLAYHVADRFRSQFGDRHPYHLAAWVCYQSYRQREAAARSQVTEFRTILARIETVMGERHPWLVAARVAFGNLLFEIGDVREALTLDRATYELAVEVLGPEHPDTLVAGLNQLISSEKLRRPLAGLSTQLSQTADGLLGREHRIARAVHDRVRLDVDIELTPF